MEITTFGMYLFTRLDGVVCISTITSIVLGVAMAFFILMFLLSDGIDEKANKLSKKIIGMKRIWFMFIFFITLAMLTPTQKEAAAIYLVPKIVNNEQIQQLPNNAVNLLNKQLEEWIADFDIKDKGEE